jgi:carbamoyltransferase
LIEIHQDGKMQIFLPKDMVKANTETRKVLMIILGLTHPISWNNAACILINGQLVAMVEEERLNRIKHAPRMAPRMAMDYCLKTAGVTLNNVDYIAIGFDTAVRAALGNIGGDSIFSSLNQAALWLRDGIAYEKELPIQGVDKSKIIFVDHHLSHAASTYYPSGFKEANIISLDGSGGDKSGILAKSSGEIIEVVKTISNRGSWGLLYELVTEKLGFRRHSGEGKVMGLAAYGIPDPAGLPCVNWDGEIPEIDPLARKNFIKSLATRQTDDPISEYHKNLAATLQDTLERACMRMAEWLYQQTGYRRLCLAGGTALNCSMNGKLVRQPFVEEIFIQPAAHDAGTALGAALFTYYQMTGERPPWKMEHAYWGPEYDNEDIKRAIMAFQELKYKKSDDIITETAHYLAEGKIIGWFQGRVEIGPRALGNRTILGDPSNRNMKDRINKLVKHREPWRPFAPSILEEKVGRYVDDPVSSPYMILAFNTKTEAMDEIISATHIDGTCRPQTVSKKTNPRYWKLIQRFEEITGVPGVLNTSFNVANQPIVNTPQEAIDTFLNCGMELLAIGDYLIWK